MKEFQSQLEQLLATEELLFDATPGFGRFKPFLEQSIAHPAKMNTNLTEYLIRTLTKEGEVILDPMSGSGQTGVIATLMGRDAICVELEEKFHKWQLEAKIKLEMFQTLSTKGKMSCVLGDARKLRELLTVADAIVTSPPYGNSKKGDEEEDRMANNLEKHGLTEETRRNRHTPGRLRAMKSMVSGYSNSEENIGNLPLGEIDAIITSPPYGEAQEGKGIAVNGYQGDKHSPTDLVGQRSYMPDKFESEGNISKLKHGEIDVVITSPPYSEGIGHPAGENASKEHEARLEMQRKYTEQMTSEGNIGSLKHGEVDAVITSPPYEGSLEDRKGGGILTREGAGPNSEATSTRNLLPCKYSSSKTNIGNLKKETYLEAMLQVYREMFNVLKVDGQAIIVIKPFIRNKKVVDLPYQTWLLMQKCGFKLTKIFKLRLTQQSFWRILYQKKHPEVDIIAHEYVLVCQK